MKIKLNSAGCYNLLLTICMFYFSYRYIFRWANEGTSGSYANTPVIIQILKYMICVVLVGFSFFLKLIKNHGIKVKRNNAAFKLLVFIFLDSFYAFVVVKDQNTFMIFIGVLITLAMCLTIKGNLNFEYLDKVFVFFIKFSIIYELIQIGLYLTMGRLPAIAWANAGLMQVRFGGVFDDPFAQSLFMSFLIPYAYHRFYGLKRILYVTILIVFLILTWTLTTILSIIVIYVIDRFYVIIKGKGVNSTRLILIIILGIFGAGVTILYGEQFLARVIEVKGASIKTHLETIGLAGLNLPTFLGLAPKGHYAESSISKMLFTNGIFFEMAFYTLGFYSVRRFIKIIKCFPVAWIKYKPIFYGMIYYQLCFLLASVNLPFPYMFFNMVVFSIFMGISFIIDIEDDTLK